jgi:hypothetical protein
MAREGGDREFVLVEDKSSDPDDRDAGTDATELVAVPDADSRFPGLVPVETAEETGFVLVDDESEETGFIIVEDDERRPARDDRDALVRVDDPESAFPGVATLSPDHGR